MIVKKDNVERIVDQVTATAMAQVGWQVLDTETVPESALEEAEEKPAKRNTKKKAETEGAN